MNTQIELPIEEQILQSEPSSIAERWKRYRGYVTEQFRLNGDSWGTAFDKADDKMIEGVAHAIYEDFKERITREMVVGADRGRMVIGYASLARVMNDMKKTLGD